MVSIKSDREIELLRAAGTIVYETHQYLKPFIVPGVSTEELDKLAYDFIISKGAKPNFKGYNGYPATICASVNEVVVHGIPSKKIILKEGDIIAIDMGCIKDGYHGDSAWSYPVGNISPAARQLLDETKNALYEAIKVCKPGAHIGDIGYTIENYLKKFNYGIVTDYSGHGIGRALHEDPSILHVGKLNEGVVLKKGMVFCIEPMINLGSYKIKVLKDGWTAVTVDNTISAHFEHMVAITEDGFDILSDGHQGRV